MATEDTDDREDSSGSDFSGLPTTPPTVTLSERQDDDDDEPSDAQQQRDKTGRWAEKKTGRDKARGGMRATLAELQKSNATLQEKLNTLASSSAAERSQMMALMQTAAQQRTQAAPAAKGPETDSEVKQLKQMLVTERELLARDPKRPTDKYDEIQDQLIDARAKAVAKAMLSEMRQPGDDRGSDSSDEARRAVWRTTMESEFPWLATSKEAQAAAGQYRQYLLASGKPNTIETVRLAVAHVGKEMGLGGHSPPTARQRNGFVAPPAGLAASPGGGPRQISVPAGMLQGTGLSPKRLNKILFEE